MLEDAGGAVARARAAGVAWVVTVGVDIASSERAIEAAARHPDLYATVGLHPHDAKNGTEEALAHLESLARLPGVVGVGETGLDYHYDNSPRADQRRVFRAQVRLAKRAGKALVIHTREAWEDTFATLETEGPPERLVFHCWSGSEESALRALALGATISFSGTVTFKNAAGVRASAAAIPLERIVAETDSPFLAPVPHRGRPNEPAWVRHVVEALAAVKGVSTEEAARATSENARRLFGLPLPSLLGGLSDASDTSDSPRGRTSP
ncbi:MAG: TatD family hydrolase [Acidobacteria bacterium]|nr:TatD family hydrolase [Acidobacteriota bacterium]